MAQGRNLPKKTTAWGVELFLENTQKGKNLMIAVTAAMTAIKAKACKESFITIAPLLQPAAQQQQNSSNANHGRNNKAAWAKEY